MIEKVRLLNFISHTDTALNLRSGVTVFVGRNGAGKSSIIDGITYALYGEHTRRTNENLVRRGASSASASVEFTVAGRRFIVERKLNKKGQLERSVLKEVLNGSATKQLASGERKQFGESLSEEVAKVTGLDYERMKVAAVIQQGELDSIVNLSAKDTKELVNGLIGIDQLGLAYESSLQVMNSFRSIVKNEHGYDDTDLQPLLSKIQEKDSLFNSSSQALMTLTAELEGLRVREAALDQNVKAMEPLKVKAELLLRQKETLVDYVKQEKREMEDKSRELNEILGKGVRYLEVIKEDERIAKESEDAVGQESTNEALLQELSKQIATLEALQDKPEKLSKLVQKGRLSLQTVKREESIRRVMNDAEWQMTELDSRLENMNEEKGKYEGQKEFAGRLEFKNNICPMCGSKVDTVNELFDRDAIAFHIESCSENIVKLGEKKQELMSVLKRAQDEVRALEEGRTFLMENRISGDEDIRSLELEKEELITRISNLSQTKELYRRTRSGRESIKKKVNELNDKKREIALGRAYLQDHAISSADGLNALREKKEGLDRALRDLPVDIESLKRVLDVTRLGMLAIDSHSTKLFQEISNLSVEASTFDEREYLSRFRELEELRSKTIASKTGDVERCKGQMQDAEEALRELRRALTISERTANYVKLLETIRAKVYHRDGPVSSSLRSWALKQIASKASEYTRLFGIGVSTINLREKTREITIECYGPRGMVEIDSLSGGEKVAVALALRFAMAYVMGGYKLDFIILDEPTVHLDEERKAKMVEIISSLGRASSPLKQIIIITHDSEIFENAEVQEIYRFESSPEGTRVRLEA